TPRKSALMSRVMASTEDGGSVDDYAHDLDAQPHGVVLVAAALADVVIVVAALVVVETDEELFLILRQLDLERLAGRQALERRRTLRLAHDRIGVLRLRRQGQDLQVAGRQLGIDAGGAGAVLARLVAAAINLAARPDADDVALANSPLDGESDLGPA